jgi:hypothetical protein
MPLASPVPAGLILTITRSCWSSHSHFHLVAHTHGKSLEKAVVLSTQASLPRAAAQLTCAMGLVAYASGDSATSRTLLLRAAAAGRSCVPSILALCALSFLSSDGATALSALGNMRVYVCMCVCVCVLAVALLLPFITSLTLCFSGIRQDLFVDLLAAIREYRVVLSSLFAVSRFAWLCGPRPQCSPQGVRLRECLCGCVCV